MCSPDGPAVLGSACKTVPWGWPVQWGEVQQKITWKGSGNPVCEPEAFALVNWYKTGNGARCDKLLQIMYGKATGIFSLQDNVFWSVASLSSPDVFGHTLVLSFTACMFPTLDALPIWDLDITSKMCPTSVSGLLDVYIMEVLHRYVACIEYVKCKYSLKWSFLLKWMVWHQSLLKYT